MIVVLFAKAQTPAAPPDPPLVIEHPVQTIFAPEVVSLLAVLMVPDAVRAAPVPIKFPSICPPLRAEPVSIQVAPADT